MENNNILFTSEQKQSYKEEVNNDWWSEEYGFFGSFYMEGDDSIEGYLIEKKQDLNSRTKTEVDGVLNLLKLNDNAEILDCPCGYGRHSIELAQRGFSVVGVDLNTAHLRQAKQKLVDHSLNVSFVKENMLDINSSEEYDAVINMFYSFGFFESDEENEKVLKNFYNSLKKGGKFLMHTDVNIPRIISGMYKEDETRQLKNGKVLKIIDRYDDQTKRINGEWIIENSFGQIENKRDYSVRVYTNEEFIELCYNIGFSRCESFSNWEGLTYNEYSEDMIIVATK